MLSLMGILSMMIIMGSMLTIGALLTKKVQFNADTQTLFITLLVYITIPSMILFSFLSIPMEEGLFPTLVAIFSFSLGIYVLSIGIGWFVAFLLRMPVQKRREMSVITAQGNTGFIGLPLSVTLFGAQGALYAAVYDVATDLAVWTVSVMVLQSGQKYSWKFLKGLINFPLMAFALGLVLVLLQMPIPDNLLLILERLATMAAPLALIYIGFYIPKLMKKIGSVHFYYLTVAVAVRLLLIPVVVAYILKFLAWDDLSTQVILFLAMMPTGLMVPVLFTQYKMDEEFGTSATIFSTLFSIITIPLMVVVTQWIIG